MNKLVKQEIEKVSNGQVILIPEIMSSGMAPANRQGYIDSMAQKVLTGELTYYDIGRSLQLTNNQIKYCEEFAIGEKMGNGRESAIRAYGYDPLNKQDRQTAANYAYQFNKPTHPCSTLIQIMINGAGLNANNLAQNLLFVATQNNDLKAKVLAIREGNTLLGLNNTKRIEVTVSHKLDYLSLPKKDLAKLIEIARKAKINDPDSE